MKVIVYEGLFGFLFGNKMSTAFEKACPGLEYERRSWMSKKAIPEGAVVLGHSFGAYRAWDRAPLSDYKALITVDLRWWFDNEDYSRPMLMNHFNIFQIKPLRGYRLISNHYNQVNLGDYGHMKAPSHPLVISKIREVCGVL